MSRVYLAAPRLAIHGAAGTGKDTNAFPRPANGHMEPILLKRAVPLLQAAHPAAIAQNQGVLIEIGEAEVFQFSGGFLELAAPAEDG